MFSRIFSKTIKHFIAYLTFSALPPLYERSTKNSHKVKLSGLINTKYNIILVKGVFCRLWGNKYYCDSFVFPN